MSTMLPMSYMSNTGITLIRPLYMTEEKNIIHASKDMPILKSKCPADKDSKRQDIKALVWNLEKTIPDCRKRIETAILSDESYNLLDKTYKYKQ